MIELTASQIEAMDGEDTAPLRVMNPRTREAFVLVPADEYARLMSDYDDSPWTREELHALAWSAGREAGWEDMDEYDDPSETP